VVMYSSTRPRKRFREMIAAHGGGHGRGLPGLAPIRNSCEWRGLCCRSCFGPRTCGRGITNSSKRFGALNQGFPFSPLQCRQGRTRMGGWEEQRKCVSCMQGLCCVLFCIPGECSTWTTPYPSRHLVESGFAVTQVE
jgi:hypothetical protein